MIIFLYIFKYVFELLHEYEPNLLSWLNVKGLD